MENNLETSVLFGIDSSSDDPLVHPKHFCNSCHLTAKRINNKEIQQTNRVLPEWLPHDDNHCVVCDTMCKGGRPRKKKAGGRPSALQKHIWSVQCPYPQYNVSHIVTASTYETDYTCIFCKFSVTCPVEIHPCKGLACSKCCTNVVESGKQFFCSFCSNEYEVASSSFGRKSPVAEKVLREMLVMCERCGQQVSLQVLENDCSGHIERAATLEDFIQQPLEVEPTHLEKQVALNLISRMMHQQGDTGTVSLPRQGGKVWWSIFFSVLA